MLDRLNCAALGFYDTSNSPRFVRGQLTRRHCPSYCSKRVSHISRRLDCRQIEYDRPALAERDDPFDAEPHGGGIALGRLLDNGLENIPVPVLNYLFGEQRYLVSRALCRAGGISGL